MERTPIRMYQAFVRSKGTDEWHPVTFGGEHFIATGGQMWAYVEQMRLVFTNNEYKVEEVC